MGLLSTFSAASGRAFGFTRSAIAAATDAFFNRVTLLLPGNGTNGAQNNTFLDSSSNNFTITRNGNTTQGTFSPFSQTGWGWNFPSGTVTTNQKITATLASSLGTGNFTHEFSFYPTALPSGFNALVFDGGTNSIVILYESTGQLSVTARDGTGAATTVISASSSTAVNLNQWNTVSVIRSGTGSGQVSLYINGVLATTGTLATNLTGTGFNLCGRYVVDGSNWYPATGYISNYRISNVARSSAVPTAPLSSDANTLILLCQANRFIDASANAITLTVNGTPSVQAFSPFAPTAAYSAATNGGSGYFDGAGDSLSVATNAALTVTGNVDACFEAWIYPTATPGANTCVFQKSGVSGSSYSNYELGFSTGRAVILFGGNSGSPGAALFTLTGATGMPLNAWSHIVGTKRYVGGGAVNEYRVFVNGKLDGYVTAANIGDANAQAFTVGLLPGGTAFTGYIAGARVFNTAIPSAYQTTNTTVGTQIFTPPTAPATAGTSSILLNYTNAGITDATAKNVLETVGNAQISTTQSKFGGASISFDGTGDWLLLPHTVDQMLGTGAFTIEMWIYRNASGTYGLVGKGTGTTGWLVSLNSSNQVVFTYGSSTITSTGTISATTWTYIAVVREGTGTNQTKIYISGSNDGTGTVSTDFNQTNAMYVGADRTGGSAFNGYIDDLRITKGYARTIATPSSAFPLQ